MDTDKSASIVTLRPPGSKTENGAADSKNTGALFQGVKCEVPPLPTWLKKFNHAKRHWQYLTVELEKLGVLTRLDQGTLANLCMYYQQMVDASITLKEQGLLQKTPNGYQALSAAQIAYDRASGAYNKLSMQFGLTVRARKQMDLTNPNQGALDL